VSAFDALRNVGFKVARRLQSAPKPLDALLLPSTADTLPSNEAEVAEVLRTSSSVLPIGAQSSLTGGATPFGSVVMSTARLNRILEMDRDRRLNGR